MTHNDIYTKFMIEYDKANVTSSYPSLTEYEVATVLDKAYNALIAQKVTGNNVRRSAFETDIKSISDIAPLITKKQYDSINMPTVDHTDIQNVGYVNVPNDFLYYVGCTIKLEQSRERDDAYSGYHNGSYEGHDYKPIDQNPGGAPVFTRRLVAKLVPHQVADKFIASASNIPWVKNPVCYIEDGKIYIVFDSYKRPKNNFCELTYIKTPNLFAKDIHSEAFNNVNNASYFECPSDASQEIQNMYKFECNNTMAEELISLAVTFALENVESQRLNSKLNMRGLEA